MSEVSRVLLRMRDLGFALGTAEGFGQSLNRIRLQKFVYLVDSVTLLYQLLPVSEGHRTYFHGPYDPAIQNAADSLAFRGFLRMSELRRGAGHTILAEYGLTDAGRSWLERMSSSPLFRDRRSIAKDVGAKVNALGWQKLKSLAYAEPTFVALRQRGIGQLLAVDNALNNSSALFIQLIEKALWGRELVTNRELVLDLFFEFLSRYSAVRATRNSISEDPF